MLKLILLLLLALIALLTLSNILFERKWKRDVNQRLKNTVPHPIPLLTENDIRTLPLPVQNYLRFCGVINRPRVENMRVVMQGEMRSKEGKFFPFRSVQYNFTHEPARLFYMKGKIFGVGIPGYHRFANGAATMDIRLFGLIPLVRKSGTILTKTELVTLFNDMCLMAPATLIDPRIQWRPVDSLHAEAIFSSGKTSIHALLEFNAEGQLINFTSADRTEVNSMQQLPFSTPVHRYQNLNGFMLLAEGDAVWYYPDGPFTYGKFRIDTIEYNLKESAE